jgi:HlyD family secretion protein
MSRRPLILLIFFLAIGAGAALGAWLLFLRPLAVAVAHAERDVSVQVFGLGTVEARIASKVGFKVSGVLVDLRADVGDRVPKGAALAGLDSREQKARLGRAKAATEQAEANLQRAMASLEKAQVNLANAMTISERRQKLVQSNITSVESAQSAKAVQDAAQADVDLAKSEIAVARAAISDAKAQHEQEAATFDFYTLPSPYDAMVITRHKELGSALGAGEAVFTLIDPQSVWVLAYIDESKSGEIRLDNPAEIILRSLPGRRFHGRVARIETESDRVNEERRVQIAFDRLPDDFHLGEQAEVFITTVRLDAPVLVPEAAVSAVSQGRGTVWIVKDGRLDQHEVAIGHRLLDGRLEVVAGIPDGAMVLTAWPSGLRVGRAATIARGEQP